MHGPSLLDERLAEIDRELSRIQSSLQSDPQRSDRRRTRDVASGPRPGQSAGLIAQLRALTDAYERLLGQAEKVRASVLVDAGPFADVAAVRSFRDSLATLEAVCNVDVREYSGGDRVVLDVTLLPPSAQSS